MWGRVKINQAVQCELTWFIEHVNRLDRILFFDSMIWHDEDWGYSTLTVHVNASVQEIGIWFLSEKRSYQCHLPPGAQQG